MSAYNHDERRSFLIFLFFVVATGFFITFGNGAPQSLGVLGIIWGIFGFFRLIHLNIQEHSNIPKILTLPSRLLFGLSQLQEEKMLYISKRLAASDIIFWVLGSVAFIAFAIYCSFYPSEISVVKTMQLQQETIVDFPIKNNVNPYAIMQGLSYYGIMGIVIFCGLSFSQSRTNIRWAFYSLLPVFITASLFTIAFSPIADPVSWPNLSVLKGGGLGQANIMMLIAPSMMGTSGTGLLSRFMELGGIGAYAPYILFAPAFFVMARVLVDRSRRYLKPFIGVMCLVFLLILDFLWVSNSMISGLMVMGLTLVSLCWGATLKRH